MQTNNLNKNYLLDYSREELYQYIQDMGMAPYRAEQLMKGIYVQKFPDFSEISTLSKSVRERLNEKATLRTFEPI